MKKSLRRQKQDLTPAPVGLREYMNLLLDRNYVIEIENFNLNKRFNAAVVLRARKYDSPQNFISPIVSIFEGSTARSTLQTILNDIKREQKIVDTFFKEARTDGGALKTGVMKMALALNNHNLNERNFQIESISKVKALLGQESSRENSRGKFEEFKENFSNPTQKIWGMAALVGIASIFGNAGARGILKQNKKVSSSLLYNSFSDIKLISWLAILNCEALKKDREELKILSDDAKLIEYLAALRLEKSTMRSDKNNATYTHSISRTNFLNHLPFLQESPALRAEVSAYLSMLTQ